MTLFNANGGPTPYFLSQTLSTVRPNIPTLAARSFGRRLRGTHNSFGDRSFSASGPRVWNALLSYLRQDMNYKHFKISRKGHMLRL